MSETQTCPFASIPLDTSTSLDITPRAVAAVYDSHGIPIRRYETKDVSYTDERTIHLTVYDILVSTVDAAMDVFRKVVTDEYTQGYGHLDEEAIKMLVDHAVRVSKYERIATNCGWFVRVRFVEDLS